jgi:glycosyltransferase involved in cell wall biosynthesis
MHFTHFNAPVLYNKPSVVTIHDLTLHFYPGKKKTSIFHRLAYKYIIGNALRKAKKVITVSENTKKDLQDTQKISSDKIAVIYEGVNKNYRRIDDKSVIEKVKDKYKLTRPYLLYTGVWRDHKNLPNLIEAFNILKNDFGFDGQLVITGRHDPLYASDIVGKAISLKLDNDVVFTGLVDEDELPPLYNGALIYVFPSLYEGFGLPPLEAMQCGTPVAASITSCIPEVCGKWNAVYFDPKDSSDMASKIFALISEKSLRERLIARGLEHVKNFSWEKMAEETLSVYNSILCGTPSKT